VRGELLNHPNRFDTSNGYWPGVARQQVTFSCLAKRKVTKEKATRLRCPAGPLASALKPGDAETRFAMIAKEAKLKHPRRC
jgi:hypothetical protein